MLAGLVLAQLTCPLAWSLRRLSLTRKVRCLNLRLQPNAASTPSTAAGAGTEAEDPGDEEDPGPLKL